MEKRRPSFSPYGLVALLLAAVAMLPMGVRSADCESLAMVQMTRGPIHIAENNALDCRIAFCMTPEIYQTAKNGNNHTLRLGIFYDDPSGNNYVQTWTLYE